MGALAPACIFCGETKTEPAILTTVSADIWTVVEPYLAAERLELDDVELLGRGPGTLLRVVVDGEDVNIDRLADVSRGISRLLDNETELVDAYRLEVTSPGLERDLRRPSHYAKSVGREVVVKSQTATTRPPSEACWPTPVTRRSPWNQTMSAGSSTTKTCSPRRRFSGGRRRPSRATEGES